MGTRPPVHHEVRQAEVIEVIRIVSTRGDGIGDPFREVTSYWTPEGVQLVEVDFMANP